MAFALWSEIMRALQDREVPSLELNRCIVPILSVRRFSSFALETSDMIIVGCFSSWFLARFPVMCKTRKSESMQPCCCARA
jgi:hypothetical protein